MPLLLQRTRFLFSRRRLLISPLPPLHPAQPVEGRLPPGLSWDWGWGVWSRKGKLSDTSFRYIANWMQIRLDKIRLDEMRPFLLNSPSSLLSEVLTLDSTEKTDCLGTTGSSLVNQVRRVIWSKKELCYKQSDYMFTLTGKLSRLETADENAML